jgi:ATP adenylyltransferase
MESDAGKKPRHTGRFAFLLAPGECLRPIYDEVLLETHGCVVTPTLGSILANWLLVVPRTPVINFARWLAAGGAQPCDLVEAILKKYDIANTRVIWFEHGPSDVGSSTGCGVDQAHLHVIVDAPFSFHDFVSGVTEASQLAWQNGSARTAHQSVKPEASYLIAASMDRAVVAQKVESVGSQYFRRVIADLVQQPDTWNYRAHPHLDNVRETIRTFSG